MMPVIAGREGAAATARGPHPTADPFGLAFGWVLD